MKAYKDLISALDKLVTVYRHLLDVVRRENEVLVAIEMEKVVEINEAKEKLVLKIRQLDASWQAAADELAKKLNMSDSKPTLLDLSAQFQGDESQKLQQLHSVLNMLVNRIAEINKKNGELVKSALSHITGAMDSITGTLNENPTYKKSGGMDPVNNDAQGRLVSREA